MKKVLIYSPALDGHPQIYCRVISEILLSRGAKVVIASGQCNDVSRDYSSLRQLLSYKNLEFIPTPGYSKGGGQHLTAEELRYLQAELDVDSTLFITPEFFRTEFERLEKGSVKALKGRNVGIFGNTTNWYPGEHLETGNQ